MYTLTKEIVSFLKSIGLNIKDTSKLLMNLRMKSDAYIFLVVFSLNVICKINIKFIV